MAVSGASVIRALKLRGLLWYHASHTSELLVRWVVFPGADTWEELKFLSVDVPIRLLEFLNSTEKDSLIAAA